MSMTDQEGRVRRIGKGGRRKGKTWGLRGGGGLEGRVGFGIRAGWREVRCMSGVGKVVTRTPNRRLNTDQPLVSNP